MTCSKVKRLLGERTLQMAVEEVVLVNIFSCKMAPVAYSEVLMKACSLIEHIRKAITSLKWPFCWRYHCRKSNIDSLDFFSKTWTEFKTRLKVAFF